MESSDTVPTLKSTNKTIGEPASHTGNPPSQPVTLNAALFYKSEDWRFGLAFKNIGDVKYVETVNNRRGSANFYGDPFTIQATASWQF